jgi:hypothetical protein
MAREDQHLEFLNEEGLEYLAELFEEGEAPFKEDVLELQQSLASCHSLLQFQLSSLLSAYLLTRHVQKVHMDVQNKDEQSELIKRDCTQYYEISYGHLQSGECDQQAQSIQTIDKHLADTTENTPPPKVISGTEQVEEPEPSDGSDDNSSDDSSIADTYIKPETSAVSDYEVVLVQDLKRKASNDDASCSSKHQKVFL